MMQDEVVERRKWMTRDEFLDLLGAANLIPGPNSTELAIHVGHRQRGWPGLLVAGVCFILPALVIVTLVAWAYVRYGSLPQVSGILYGVKPVIIAIVLQALWSLGRTAIKTKLLAIVFVVGAVLTVLGVHELIVLFGGGVVLAGALGSPTAMADPDTSQIAQFGFFDPLANIGFAALFWGGVRYRHKVQLHARYMLATLLFVVSPIGFRLLGRYVPAFSSDTPETAWRFAFAMGGGNLIAFGIALYLYSLAPKHGRPFLLAAGVIAAQGVTYETLGRLPSWAPVFASVSAVNLPFLLMVTGIVSIGLAWHGWVAGARPAAPQAAALV